MQSEDLVKYKLGVNWQLIFFHNSTGRVFFEKNSSDLLFCNKSQQFSNLGILTNNYKTKGFFEFLIEYPEINFIIHWKQKKNPVKASSNVGFVPLRVDNNTAKFNGLALSSATSLTFLDGNIGSGDWHYAIGSYESWGGSERFPGPLLYNEDNNFYGISLVYMYVRIKTSLSCKISKGISFKSSLMIMILMS